MGIECWTTNTSAWTYFVFLENYFWTRVSLVYYNPEPFLSTFFPLFPLLVVLEYIHYNMLIRSSIMYSFVCGDLIGNDVTGRPSDV